MTETFVKTRVVGVDISYDETTCAIVDIRGRILAKETFGTQEYQDISSFVNKLSEVIVMIGEASGGFEHVRSVGISTPSGNFLTGCIENSPNMPWKGVVPLAAMLRDR
ncbi:MAG: ROK family protein, partial [Prevotella sp.]